MKKVLIEIITEKVYPVENRPDIFYERKRPNIKYIDAQSEPVKITYKYLVDLIIWLIENNNKRLAKIIIDILPSIENHNLIDHTWYLNPLPNVGENNKDYNVIGYYDKNDSYLLIFDNDNEMTEYEYQRELKLCENIPKMINKDTGIDETQQSIDTLKNGVAKKYGRQ